MQSTFRRTVLAAVMLGIAACGDTPTEVVPPIAETPTEIAFHLSGEPLAWAGYQDGNGAWTEVKGVPSGTGHTYSLTMTAPTGAIAYVFTLTCSAINWVNYGTAAELKAMYSGWQSGTPAGLKTVHGSVAGGFASGSSNVWLGGTAGGFAFVQGESGSITLAGVPLGPQDLVASRHVRWDTTDKMIVRRNLDIANGETIPLLDFSSSEAIALDSARLTIQDFGGNALTNASVSSVLVYTANGGLGRSSAATKNGTTWYRGLPASATIAGDMHQISAGAAGRSVQTVIGPLANHTVSLGPAAATPTVATVSSGTPMRRRMTIPVQAEYSKSATARFETGTRPYYSVYMTMTGAYRGSGTSWILEIPDFGANSGYNTAWGLQGGPRQLWSATVAGWDGPDDTSPAVGQTRRAAGVASTSAGLAALPSFGEIESRHPRRSTSSEAGSAQFSCLPG